MAAGPTLFDPDDPGLWVEIIRNLHGHLGSISESDAKTIIERVVGRPVRPEQVEDALLHAGFEADDSVPLWTLRYWPIIGTGNEDSFSEGGGILMYDAVDDDFTWWWWTAPEEVDPDDESAGVTYEVRHYNFSLADDLLDRLGDWVDMDGLERNTGEDASTIREWATGDSAIDRVRFLEAVIREEGYDALDPRPVTWSGDELTRGWGPQTVIVARRTFAEAEDLLRSLLERDRRAADEQAELAELLGQINARRRELGMRNLDPDAAGWSADDIRIEAQRLRQGNPPTDLRGELLRW